MLFIIKMFKKSTKSQKVAKKWMPSSSEQQAFSQQKIIIPFRRGRQEHSLDLVNLNQKYDQLRRKREELIRLLKGNYRLARVRSEVDAYFEEEDKLLNQLSKVESKHGGTGCSEVTEKCIDYRSRLTDHKCYILNLFDLKAAASENRMVSFGEVSFSTFTTLAEDAPNAAVLTDSTPQDNGVNLVSSGSQKEKSDSPTQNTSQVGKSGNYSLENKLAREEEKRLLKLQKVEERQEKAKKKANIESKKLQMEFERKQRQHEERMRQVEEKLQLRLMEAELESSSGETSDKSKQSSETESDDEFSPKELHAEYDEYTENLKVQLPEVERPSSSFLKTDSYSSRLTKYRQQYSLGEDIENPFEQQTRIQSTPLGSRDRRFSPDRYAYSNSF